MTLACIGNAGAQAPPPDHSAALFAGEWTGIGEGGANCYLRLDANGRGWVLIDGGAGDQLSHARDVVDALQSGAGKP